MKEDPWEFSQHLIAARLHRQLTQETLASRAALHTTQLSHFETSARKPSLANLRRLALALAVPSDYLLGLVTTMDRSVATDSLYGAIQALTSEEYLLVKDFIRMVLDRREHQ